MSTGTWLLDTGAVVALLHADDAEHEAVADAFREFRGTLITTEAVLTECLYVLAGVDGGPSACMEFFIRGGAVLVPASRTTLVRSKSILEQYADLPADYADASLVALAEDFGTWKIMTLDRRDFSVYRGVNGERFEIVPS